MRRHELDLVSLLAGVVFLAVAAGHLIGQALGSPLDSTWVVPLALVALGLAGMIGGLGRSMRRPETVEAPATNGVGASAGADAGAATGANDMDADADGERDGERDAARE